MNCHVSSTPPNADAAADPAQPLPPFNAPLASGILAAAAAPLAIFAAAVMPLIFGEAVSSPRHTALLIGLLVWLLGAIGMVMLAWAARRGLYWFGGAFFASMGVRMTGALGGAAAMSAAGWVDAGKPLAMALAMVYLPLLVVEVTLVWRHLNRSTARPAASTAVMEDRS